MSEPSLYHDRKLLRALEGTWTRFEAFVDRLTAARSRGTEPRLNFNPLYHLGTLTIVLLVILLVTGIYLTVTYKPGPARAYESLQAIDATLVGSLMRSVHRYASDALILVILLHALKMLLSDRFWGGRWLGWVSGIALLLLMAVIGVMGYFLVWDRQAQWLGEYFIGFMGGNTKFTFASPHAIEGAFQFFVIILFLHVFLSLLIALGIWIHEMRLQRPRVWAPRWLWGAVTAGLVLLAILWPVSSGPPADLTHLVTQVNIDWLYGGFLPLSRQFSPLGVWFVSALIVAGIGALPWLAKGRHQGPAFVTEDLCTGCAICARECPYDALEVVPRVIDDKYESTVQVNENLCTGCGLCVGDCATIGIDITGIRTERIVTDLRTALAEETEQPPVVAFTCQRHAVLGTFPRDAGLSFDAVDEHGWPGPVSVGTLENGISTPLITCTMPCAGMTQSKWIRGSLSDGASAVVLVTCPTADCGFREGPQWLIDRLQRGRNKKLLGQQVHWIESAPGDRGDFRRAVRDIIELAQPKKFRLPKAFHFAAGFVLLLLTLAISLIATQPATALTTEQGVIRLVLNHTSPVMATTTGIQTNSENLPEGITAEQVLGGARFPVKVELLIDGQLSEEWTFQPSGLHHEGAVYALETVWLDPGQYDVIVRMMDDGETWRDVFSGSLQIEEEQAAILTYAAQDNAFILSK